METLIKNIACKNCQQNFEITNLDQQFYEKMHVPEPTFCPDCRQQRRLMWRNERTLYKRKCSATGKEIISVYSEDKPFPVYENEYWYSDKWNPMDYGVDFDFSRPFFEQFKELMNRVPQLARSAVSNQNCDYINQAGYCKNCYLIFEADSDENCMYSTNIYDSRFCLDVLECYNCELCYEAISCDNSYNLKFSRNCKNCSDSFFLRNCIGCKNCFGCVNLASKEYYFLNQKCTKEEYEEKLQKVLPKNRNEIESLEKNFKEFCLKFPQKNLEGVQNEDSTGDHLSHTQRCKNCYNLHHAQDCKFVFNSSNTKNCYDLTVFGYKPIEFCYENHEVGVNCQNIRFCDQVWEGCYDMTYSKLCLKNCHDLFGCIGLRHKSYCILNKQYTPEEYKILVEKIIEHLRAPASAGGGKQTQEWGEFFPANLAFYGYNETNAQDHFPLKKEEALKKGYKWKDLDPKEYKPQNYQVPAAIKDIPDSIINEVLACQTCKKNYKIIQEELSFYKKQNLPIPLNCPDCRHKNRFKSYNPRKLYSRNCQKCNIEIQTTFAPAMPEIVYCEKCYLEALS
ncbi:MAG: zinc-ribbon domain containing protein [Patescibacteria group bacterium]